MDGHDLKGVFAGSQWFLDDIFHNTQDLKERLAENKVGFELPEHYLAFFSYQGYLAAWFDLPKAGEDPVVYWYNEREQKKPIIVGKFTEFLLKDMTEMASSLPLNHCQG